MPAGIYLHGYWFLLFKKIIQIELDFFLSFSFKIKYFNHTDLKMERKIIVYILKNNASKEGFV